MTIAHSSLVKSRSLQLSCGWILLAVSLALTGCSPVSNNGGRVGFSPARIFGGQTVNGLAGRNPVQPGFAGGFGQSIFGRQTGIAFGAEQSNAIAQNTLRSGSAPRSGQNDFGGGNLFGGPSATQSGQNGLASQVQSLNQRVTAFDSDNQLLNTEVAALKQKLQLSNNYSQTLKQQLADSSQQIQAFNTDQQATRQQLANALQQLEVAKQQQAQLAANARINGDPRLTQAGFGNANVPSQLPNGTGSATLGANNSLLNKLNQVRIPGGQARMDGDVIRIEFPSDRMFVPGTYQLQPTQLPALQALVGAIRQSFPRQIVGIEAHWDGTPLNPASTSHHQLTATQALSVFDRLTAMGVPKNQLFTMAMGSNRPRHAQSIANGISPNRRIELVIYPETFDGS
jgi:flagellar motor protein MotB